MLPAKPNSSTADAWRNTASVYQEVVSNRASLNKEILGFGTNEVCKTLVGMYGPTERGDFDRILLALGIDAPNLHILDLGSGTGQLILPLAMLSRHPITISGIEFDRTLFEESVHALQVAQQRGLIEPGQVKVYQGDFFDPKFEALIRSTDRIFYYLSSSDHENKLEKLMGMNVTKENARIVTYGDNPDPFPKLREDYGFTARHDPMSLISTYTKGQP